MLNTLCLRINLAGAKAPFLPPDPVQDFYRNRPDALSSMESLGCTANVLGSPGPQQPCFWQPAISISMGWKWKWKWDGDGKLPPATAGLSKLTPGTAEGEEDGEQRGDDTDTILHIP